MLVIRNTTTVDTVPAGQDKVAAWAPIPQGGKLISVAGEVHVIGTEGRPVNKFAAYGWSGELVPIMDPDTSIGLNTLWDNMVVKPVEPTTSAGNSTVDWDFETANQEPDVEPGEVDIVDLTGLVDPTKSIMDPQIEWLSAAKGTPIAVFGATPDTYTPRSYKTFRSSRGLVADMPSYALLAFSSPLLGDTQSSVSTPSTIKKWAILENLRNVMEDFWRINTGMIEAGAEDPYSLISTNVANLVAPDMVDPSDLMDPQTYTFMCRATWVLEFPGSSIPNTLEGNNE